MSRSSGAKAIVPSSGKKLPVWAMAADASASKSGSAALLRVKRKEPDDSTDDDDDVVEVYAGKNLAKKNSTQTLVDSFLLTEAAILLFELLFFFNRNLNRGVEVVV
jgi:hypothetical protein